MNLYEVGLGEGARTIQLGSQAIDLPDSVRTAHPKLAAFAGQQIVAGLRPEHLPFAEAGAVGQIIEGDVDLVEALGSELLVHFSIDAVRVTAEGVQEEDEQMASGGEGVARVDPRAPLKPGNRARFVVDVERMQFFDPNSGLAIWD
jgi:multiple sugar transport system ATP-binding protein